MPSPSAATSAFGPGDEFFLLLLRFLLLRGALGEELVEALAQGIPERRELLPQLLALILGHLSDLGPPRFDVPEFVGGRVGVLDGRRRFDFPDQTLLSGEVSEPRPLDGFTDLLSLAEELRPNLLQGAADLLPLLSLEHAHQRLHGPELALGFFELGDRDVLLLNQELEAGGKSAQQLQFLVPLLLGGGVDFRQGLFDLEGRRFETKASRIVVGGPRILGGLVPLRRGARGSVLSGGASPLRRPGLRRARPRNRARAKPPRISPPARPRQFSANTAR